MRQMLLSLLLVLSLSGPAEAAKKPCLVVAISIDQFRPDYFTRFYEHYLPPRKGGKPGGFRYLLSEGANFPNGRLAHFPSYTGPGHATILTGTSPNVNGVIGNLWYSRDRNTVVYCAEDPTATKVGYESDYNGVSPKPMLARTLGDELKKTTNGRSKVVGLAYKDRGAIFMAGHDADTVIWFDSRAGNWVSSGHYCPDGKLPEWVSKLNAERLVDRYFGATWEPLLPEVVASLGRPPVEESLILRYGFSTSFPHTLKGDGKLGKAFYGAYISSGLGNDHIIEVAKRALVEENLGKDDAPDILAISLSSNDYVGHFFGPNSPEVVDASIRTDRALADLFAAIDKHVGLDCTVFAVTSDHGVAPIPGDQVAQGLEAGQVKIAAVEAAALEAIAKKHKEGPWIASLEDSEPHLYLDYEALDKAEIPRNEAARLAANAIKNVEGIADALTREDILGRKLPKSLTNELVYNGYHPDRGGDVVLITKPGWFVETDRYSTTHGTPYDYDIKVPVLVSGPGLNSGTFYREVTSMDIAPTLAKLLGIDPPDSNQGEILREALTESK